MCAIILISVTFVDFNLIGVTFADLIPMESHKNVLYADGVAMCRIILIGVTLMQLKRIGSTKPLFLI
jgi:hypothetical protein